MRTFRVSPFLIVMGTISGTGALAQADYNSAARDIDQQFSEQARNLKQQLAQAQQGLRDCATQDAQRKNELAAQKAAEDGQRKQDALNDALGGGNGGGGGGGGPLKNLGDLANSVIGNPTRQAGKQASQRLNSIERNVDQLNQMANMTNVPQNKQAAQADMAKDLAKATQQIQRENPNLSPQQVSEKATEQVSPDYQPLPPGLRLADASPGGGLVANYAAIQQACQNKPFRSMAQSWGMGSYSYANTNGIIMQPPGAYGGYTPSADGYTARQCVGDLMQKISYSSDGYDKALANKANAGSLLGDLTKAAVNSVVGSLGAGLKNKAAQQHADAMNDAAVQNTDAERQACEQAANDQINQLKQAMNDNAEAMSRALADAKLRASAANQRTGQPQLGSTGGNGTAGGSMNIGSPDNLMGKNPSIASAGGGGAAPAGAAAAGAPGGGAGGGSGDTPWTFGSGQGYGGIPPGGPMEQPSFTQEGGGGGAGFGGMGGDGGFFADPFADPNANRAYASEDGYGEGVGDGGLLVLQAKARNRLMEYADLLVQSVDLKKMAASPIQ